jgi:hypothetical protein
MIQVFQDIPEMEKNGEEVGLLDETLMQRRIGDERLKPSVDKTKERNKHIRALLSSS